MRGSNNPPSSLRCRSKQEWNFNNNNNISISKKETISQDAAEPASLISIPILTKASEAHAAECKSTEDQDDSDGDGDLKVGNAYKVQSNLCQH